MLGAKQSLCPLGELRAFRRGAQGLSAEEPGAGGARDKVGLGAAPPAMHLVGRSSEDADLG